MGEDEGNFKKAITLFLQSRKSRNTVKTWLNKKEFNYIKFSMSKWHIK